MSTCPRPLQKASDHRIGTCLLPTTLQPRLQVAQAVRHAAVHRDRQQLLLVRRFASQVPSVKCEQLLALLQLLAHQGPGQVRYVLWWRTELCMISQGNHTRAQMLP